MSKFVTVKKCIRSIPPVAFRGEEVNVRREFNRYVVTNGETGHNTVLTRAELDDHFETLPTIGAMGL
jgi:hypothetical protein